MMKMTRFILPVIFFVSSIAYAVSIPEAAQPLVNELDVKTIKQKISRTTNTKDKDLLYLSLAAAYYKAEKYGEAYNTASKIIKIPYMDDYVEYYKYMSAMNHFSDASSLRRNFADLYRIYSHGGVVSELIDDDLPYFEAKTAQALVVVKDYPLSIEYLARARNRDYSDLDVECKLYKAYINYDKKLALALFLDLYSRFGEKDSNKCFNTLGKTNRDEIEALIAQQDQKLSTQKGKTNADRTVPDILDLIKKAIGAKDYSTFRDLAEQGLKRSSQGKQTKKFYDVVHPFVESTLINNVHNVSYFSDMFEYYDKDYLEKLALKLLQKAEWSKSEDILRLIVKRFPLYDKGIYLLAGLYEDMNKKSKALRLYKSVVDDFPKSEYYQRALFKYAWLEMLDGDYKTSSEIFSRYLDEGGDNYDWAITAALYFKSKCLRKMSKDDEAKATIDDLMSRYPFSFYSLLSMDELGMNIVENLEQNIKEPKYDVEPISVNDIMTINRSVRLVRAGLFDMAKKELSEVDLDKLSPEYIEVIANLYKYANLTDLALNAANKLLTTLKGYTSREHAETNFPKPYFELVDNFSKASGVEPYVIFAIMKRESAFNKDAVSRSGAQGLMQLMPYTAVAIDSKVDSKKLKDAETNIKIASLYLKKLSEKYNGNLVYVAAAYNAGEDALDRWRNWYGSRMNEVEFIENIPYLQTRMYVKSVIANYYMYNALYLKKHVKFSDVLGK